MTLKEYYKKRLTEDSLNETSARRKLATMAITGSLSALGGSVLGAAAPHIRSATIGNPVAQARQNTANSFGLFGSETHPARRAMAGAGVGLGVSQVGDMVGGIVSAIRRRRKLEEATPAEIQAHQIQRLDKLGDKVGQKNLDKPANLRAATRIAMLYNKAGVAGGKYPYSGIAGSPGMISMPTRPAHPQAIAAAETGLKRLRGSNRTVGQRIRGAIKRTIGLEEAIRGDTTSRQTQTRMRKVRGLDPKRTNGVTPQDHASLDMLDPLNRIRQRGRNRELRAGSIDTTFARTKAQQRALDKVFKAEFGIPE